MSDLERIRPELVLGRAPAPDPQLAAAREAWAEVAGDAAAASQPVRMTGESTVVVACRSAVWAGELGMQRPALEARLRALSGADVSLRFEVGDVPEAPSS